MIQWALVQGVVVLALVGGLYFSALWMAVPEQQVRAMAFIALVAANVSLILINRSFHRSGGGLVLRANYVLWGALALIFLTLLVVMTWAPARALFQFAALGGQQVVLAIGAGLVALTVLEILRGTQTRRIQS